MTLSAARSKAKEIFGKVESGEDPRGPEEEGVLTFKVAAEEALEWMATDTRPRTIKERQRILNRYLLPVWGDRPVTEITRADVAKLVKQIGTRAPVMANRVLSMIRATFNAMLDLERVEANPAARPKRFFQEETPRKKSLTRSELKTIIQTVGMEGPEARAFFGLCLFTVQRAGAVAAARWEEFDLAEGVWTIPVEPGRKIKEYPRKVPLNEGAMRSLMILMEEIRPHPVHLFPARAGAREPHFTGWHNLTRRLRKESGVDGWTIHNLRHTFRGMATRVLRVRPEVADLVMSHDLPSVGMNHYEDDRSTFLLDEKRDALDAWSVWLDGLAKGTG